MLHWLMRPIRWGFRSEAIGSWAGRAYSMPLRHSGDFPPASPALRSNAAMALVQLTNPAAAFFRHKSEIGFDWTGTQ